MVSENSNNEDSTETASEYSEHQEPENPDLKPDGNASVSYFEETASSEILLKGKVLTAIATERTFTKEQ